MHHFILQFPSWCCFGIVSIYFNLQLTPSCCLKLCLFMSTYSSYLRAICNYCSLIHLTIPIFVLFKTVSLILSNSSRLRITWNCFARLEFTISIFLLYEADLLYSNLQFPSFCCLHLFRFISTNFVMLETLSFFINIVTIYQLHEAALLNSNCWWLCFAL